VAGIVKAAANPLARDLYIDKVAEKIGATADAVRFALEGKKPAAPSRKPDPARQASEPKGGQPQAGPPRLAAKIELQIVALMLQSNELCKQVEQSGAAGRFTVAALRELSERAFALAHEGELDAETLIQAAEPARLRDALLRVAGAASRRGLKT